MVTKIEQTKISKSLGGEEKLKSSSEQYKKDLAYLRDHYEELMKMYRNHWIGLYKSEVVMSENDPKQLLEWLDKTQSKDILVYYLADPEDFMIL